MKRLQDYIMTMKKHSLAAREEGSGLLEFALSASVLFMVIFGILDCSRALYVDHFVANAARDGARYAMVRGSSWTGVSCTTTSKFSCIASSTQVGNYVKGKTPSGSINQTKVIVTTLWPGTTAAGAVCDVLKGANSPGCAVRVTVSYSFSFLLPFMPKTALVLTSSSVAPIMQ